MRDLVILAVVVLLVPLALRSSLAAYILWGWANLVALNAFSHGFAGTLPYVQIFALIWLVGFLFHSRNGGSKYPVDLTIVLFAAMAVHSTIVALMAYPDTPRNWTAYSELLKTLLFVFVMPLMLTSRSHIHAMLVAIVIAMTLHGSLAGAKFIFSGGGHVATGTFKGDNNYFAMLMAMTVPLSIYLVRYSAVRLTRYCFVLATGLTALAVIATHSRGGLLALIAVMVWIVILSKRRVAGLVFMVVTLLLALALAPASWSNRMASIGEAEQDNSFMTRVAVWKKSTAIAVEHPFVGGGFFSVQSVGTYVKYREAQGLMGFIQTPDPGMFAAHSIFFQVLSDSGFVGLFIYLAIIWATIVNWFNIRRLSKIDLKRYLWAVDLSDLILAALVAFFVGGALLSAAYFDLPIMLFGLIHTLRVCVARSIQSEGSNSNLKRKPFTMP